MFIPVFLGWWEQTQTWEKFKKKMGKRLKVGFEAGTMPMEQASSDHFP